PSVFHLPLVTEERAIALDGAGDVGEKRIEVELEAVVFGLEQRPETELVPLTAVVRQLELGDEADVDRIPPGLRELELVLELDRVEARVRALALALDIELGEPPLLQAEAETKACRLQRRLVLLRRDAVLEVELALAVVDGGKEDVVGGTCEC